MLNLPKTRYGLATLFVLAIAACAGQANGVMPSSLLSTRATSATPDPEGQPVCSYRLKPGEARCLAILNRADGPRPDIAPYRPADLVSAYHLTDYRSGGADQMIAIVDAYDNPKAELDMGVYRKRFHLGSCTTNNGCFQKVNQNGSPQPLPSVAPDWGLEIDLDIEMASAVCPKCRILLIEANTARFSDLEIAEDQAASMGANVVSNSYGGAETWASNPHYDHPGHMIIAASGDDGYYQPMQPCTLSTVVCVGGTRLKRSHGDRGWAETAWRGAGSACSVKVPKPSWQTDTGCATRSASDVAAVAGPSPGVAVYDTYSFLGWISVGGTSVATPIIAGIYALAGNSQQQNYAQGLWNGGGEGLFDVTKGTNGTCPSQYKYICTARKGYDGPTGWGTPNGILAF